MKDRVIRFAGLFFLLFISAGCDKFNFLNPKKDDTKKTTSAPLAVKGTIIAKVNNIPITLEELNKYLDIYNASIELRQDLTAEEKKNSKMDTRDKKLDYLKTLLVRQTVFYQAALDRGLDRREEIVEILQRDKIAVLAQEMQNEIIKNIDVSSAEIEEAYKAYRNFFKEPEARRVREIVVKTEEEAKQILIELLQGADFVSIVKTRSIAGSAKDAGDLGFIKKGQRGEEFLSFDEVAFSSVLQQGSVSSVFKGPDGYYIVKIEGIKEGKEIPLSEAWDVVKAQLLSGKQAKELDEAYDRLSRDFKIEIYEGEIK